PVPPLLPYTPLFRSQYLRVPHADFGPIAVGPDLPDHRYLFLSDILPTAWQALAHAGVGEGDALAVYGLGPVGQFAARIGVHRGRSEEHTSELQSRFD